MRVGMAHRAELMDEVGLDIQATLWLYSSEPSGEKGVVEMLLEVAG